MNRLKQLSDLLREAEIDYRQIEEDHYEITIDGDRTFFTLSQEDAATFRDLLREIAEGYEDLRPHS